MEFTNHNLVDAFINNNPLTDKQLVDLNDSVIEYLMNNNIQIDITNQYILDNVNKELYKFIDSKLNSDEQLKTHLNELFKNVSYEYIYMHIKKIDVYMKEIYTIFFNNYKENYIKYKKYYNLIVNSSIVRKLFIYSNGQSTSDFLDKVILDKNYHDEVDDIINLFIDYYTDNYESKFIGNILYFTKQDRKLKDKIKEYLTSIKDQLNIADFYKKYYPQILLYYKSRQEILEKDILKSNNLCQKDDLKNISQNLRNVNSEKLKYYNVNQFFNENVLKTTMCTLNSLFYTKIDDDNYHTDIIKRYINNLEKIGEESAYGYAFTANFMNADNMFVIKTPKNSKDDNLIHELIIGLYGTNKLRKDIPNFAYIYGGFKCSPMLLTNNDNRVKLESWCKQSKRSKRSKQSNSNDVNYILYENINPSISFYDYLETCSTDDFLNMFVQMLYALNYANKTIDFTHYDTKGDNILIRTIDDIRELNNFGYENNFDQLESSDDFQIKYPDGNGGYVYITTDAIPTFIDYGLSHIKTNDKLNIDIGVYDFYDKNIYGDKSWIMSDVYSILIDVILTITQINLQLYPCLMLIMKFFNKVENIDTILENSKNRTSNNNYRFNKLPYTQELFDQLTIDKLITYIRTIFNCYFISETPNNSGENPILNCESLKCVSTDELYKNILTENNTELIDLYYNYENLQTLDQEYFMNYLKTLQNFNYQNSDKNHYDNVIVINLDIIDIDNYLYENIIKYGFFKLLTLKNDILYNIFVNLIKLMDKLSLLNNYIEIGKYFALMFDNKDNYQKYEDINITNFNNNIKEYIEGYISVKDQYEILKPLESYIL